MLKKVVLLISAVVLFFPALSQQEAELDTIYMLGQKKKIVKVKGIFYTNVKYTEPGNEEIKSMKTKNIQRIIFDSGRKEVFNKPLVQDITKADWKNVVITENKNEVEGLYEVGKVKGKSSSRNRTPKSAERTAKIRMKKRAANKGGVMILITDKETTGGFGEVPTYYIEGIAFSFEKPDDQ
jgi:hypothetical protein